MQLHASMLPRWQCIKQVSADQIMKIRDNEYGSTLFLSQGLRVDVPAAWMEKFVPRVGGYLIVYDKDGYMAFKHRELFERDHVALTGEGVTINIPRSLPAPVEKDMP